MAIPSLILFERHWDSRSREFLNAILPDLARDYSYDTFCFEMSDQLNPNEMKEGLDRTVAFDSDLLRQANECLRRANKVTNLCTMSLDALSNLLHLYVSSKRYTELAEKFRNLEANRKLQETFQIVKKHSMALKGVDIDCVSTLIQEDPSQKIKVLDKYDRLREESFVEYVKKYSRERQGVVFLCGAFHAKGVVSQLDNVNYYYVHSSNRLIDSEDDSVILDPILNGHKYQLAAEDIESFKRRVLLDIHSKVQYKDVEKNSHAELLTSIFGCVFVAKIRQGYHVDAIAEVSSPEIESGLKTRKIDYFSLNGKIIIPNVNSRQSEQIRK